MVLQCNSRAVHRSDDSTSGQFSSDTLPNLFASGGCCNMGRCHHSILGQRNIMIVIEPPHGKNQQFAYVKTKAQISFAVTAKLISAFVFTTRIVQFLFYLNPKFQASSSFLCLYRPVCVGPVRKPHCWFSQKGAQEII